MNHSPLFLGVDVGTQSVRAALIDEHGHCVHYGTSPLDTVHPHPGWAEQNPAEWWQALRLAVGSALTQGNINPERIAGIGLDCTACTVIPCKRDGTPIRPALLWMDQRSYREVETINGSKHPILRFVSNVVSPEWMLPKALWIKRNEPQNYAQTERMVECTDWFMYQLTGEWTLSLNHVTVKWDYARPDGGWPEDFLQKIDLADIREKWPANIVPLGKGQGRLSRWAGQELVLPEGIPIAQGGIDAYLGMLGMGAVESGDLAMIMGSSTCHLAMSNVELLGSGMLGCYPDAVVEGLYTLEGGQTATGSIINWYRKHFAGNEVLEAERSGKNVYEILDAKAEAVPPGCEGLICLDYWQGNRCPRKDPRARGVFLGLTLAHGSGHLFRSIYEGTALGTRHILEDVASHGLKIDRLFAGGGGAKSRLWLRIQADVLGQPIHIPRESEACALGSAMVAAVHGGHYGSLEEASQQMVHIKEVIEPNTSNKDIYDQLYGNYLKTYPALANLMHRLAN